jgi:branched-chain amino acid transport system permease protein
MNINWSYYFDEFKDRLFYLFGFILIVSLTSITEWPIVGNQMQVAQDIDLLPNNAQIALFLKLATIMVIFTVSWDLLAGYNGQVSFGHALFFGMGAYFTAYFKLGYPVVDTDPSASRFHDGIPDNIQEFFGIPVDLGTLRAIFLAALLVGIIAIFISLLTLRLKGPYFALVTLVLPLIAQNLVTGVLEDQTGGQAGISMGRGRLVRDIETNPEEFSAAKQSEAEFYVFFVIMFVCVLVMYLLARSRYGLVLRSIREDELLVLSLQL